MVQDENDMKTIRTPEINYFEAGQVEFSTSRKDGELYYKVKHWTKDKRALIIVDQGKVQDEAHLKWLQCMEKEIEN